MVTSVIKFLIACGFIHVIVPSSPSKHKREEDGWCHGTNHGGRGRRWADQNRGVIGWVETGVLRPDEDGLETRSWISRSKLSKAEKIER
jgi:hypothetical protein